MPWGRAGAVVPAEQGQDRNPLTAAAELECPPTSLLLPPSSCLPLALPSISFPPSLSSLSLFPWLNFLLSFVLFPSPSLPHFFSFFPFPFPFLSTFISSSLSSYPPHPSLPPTLPFSPSFLSLILSCICTPRSPHSTAEALSASILEGVSHRGCGGLSHPFVHPAPVPLSAAICALQAPAALDEAQAWQG